MEGKGLISPATPVDRRADGAFAAGVIQRPSACVVSTSQLGTPTREPTITYQ